MQYYIKYIPIQIRRRSAKMPQAFSFSSLSVPFVLHFFTNTRTSEVRQAARAVLIIKLSIGNWICGG